MELTTLDTELLRLDQTLSELIAMGLVVAVFYEKEKDIGPTTRYRIAGRPGRWLTKKEKQQESGAPARAHAVGA